MLDDTVDASTVTRQLDGCPVKCFTVFDDQDAGRYWQEADALREETPAFFNAHAQGYWVVTRYERSRTSTRTATCSRASRSRAWEPNPPYRFVPTQIDPPEHIKYRQLLNPKFSPGAVARAEEPARVIARRLIDEIARAASATSSPSSPSASRPRSSSPSSACRPPTPTASCRGSRASSTASTAPRTRSPGMVGALEGIRGYFVDVIAAPARRARRSRDRPRLAPAGVDGRRRAA